MKIFLILLALAMMITIVRAEREDLKRAQAQTGGGGNEGIRRS